VNYYQTAEPPLGASCVCAHKQNARKEQEVMHEPCGYFRLYGRRSPPFEKPSRSGQGKNPNAKSPTCSPNANHGHTLGRMHIAHDDTPSLDTQIHPRAFHHHHPATPPFLRSAQTRTCLPSTLPARTFLSDCHNTIIMTSCFCLCYRMIVITIRAVL
jgi:hypothetical protein